ncbi:guanitoxin biosynthesis heme-dependent pre-guanitoxin N-hydroxylase GntA [Serratia ureilytica]|uniref:guanitoxin biosynthesis heme-dependent pre-guanitoxin N-hydroxylase GntA n=1 Tax=Serratia ureilytica TaxID=300181 RepID=UPI00191FD874|nr:guanitoxin biosynthesis heme-dependent pre-guanitoxin N-hydroxylase GntA [Serratia ureilytica]MBL0881094.1 YqcI/YcgG family protein [Serratia ureilytica]MDN2473358.1 YqcI/YcgG family protein [Serratia ureilytica]
MSLERMEKTNNPEVFDRFLTFVESDTFACIGAKTAIVMQTLIHRDCSFESKITLNDAYGFLKQFCSQRELLSRTNSTFVLTFSDTLITDEDAFESFLWETLQALHKIDADSGNSWSGECSSDPLSPQFGFSLMNEPFFVVGLHPHSSRKSRQSPFPVLVFNAHRQFRHLKEIGLFEKMQKEIRRRETSIQGSLNPNLSNFGDESEARQYAGNETSAGWICPFSKKNSNPRGT